MVRYPDYFVKLHYKTTEVDHRLLSKEGKGPPHVAAIFRIETVVTETIYGCCDYLAGNPAVVPGSN